MVFQQQGFNSALSVYCYIYIYMIQIYIILDWWNVEGQAPISSLLQYTQTIAHGRARIGVCIGEILWQTRA